MKRGFLKNQTTTKQSIHPNQPSQSSFPSEIPGLTLVDGNYQRKLPHGKVNNTGKNPPGRIKDDVITLSSDVPKDYQPRVSAFKEVDAYHTDYPDDFLTITTVPPEFRNGSYDPDGTTEWLVVGNTKRKVLNAPGYPQPIPKRNPKAYIVNSIPGIGKGMFATRDIALGEFIFAERPLIVTPRTINTLHVQVPRHYSYDEYERVMMFEWEKQLERTVARMEEPDKKAFLELANSHTEDGSGPLLGIIRTNGYAISGIYDGPDGAEITTKNGYLAVGKDGSRINHSCCQSNITTHFDVPSFSLQYFAVRDIKAGDQIYYHYIYICKPVAERNKDLAPYDFVCNCAACVNATPETDAFREGCATRMQYFVRKCDEWRENPNLSEVVLEPVLKFQEAVIKEGLDIMPSYPDLLSAIFRVYMKLKLREKAMPLLKESVVRTKLNAL